MPPRPKSLSSSSPWARRPEYPDCQTHPDEWLTATDKVAKDRSSPNKPLPMDPHRGQVESFFLGAMNEDVLREFLDARRMICDAHLSLSQQATILFTEHDLEKHWLALGKEGQEKHIFKAFQSQELHKNDAFPVDMFANPKLDCPELMRENLFKEGGKGFLDLLRMFLLNDNDEPPTQPYLVPNKRFDDTLGWTENMSDRRKAWLGMRRQMRTYHIMSFLSLTLAGYLGKEVSFYTVTHEHSKTKETLQNMKPMMDDILGPTAAKAWIKDQTQNRKEMRLFCAHCLKFEDKSANGKFSVCVACKRATGREVRYCGRECQRKAWKFHKRECGKNIELASVFDDVEPVSTSIPRRTSRPDIPTPDAGYTRSPDLLRLISYLNENPTKDYIIIVPHPNRPVNDPDLESIQLDEVQGAATFMVMRNRAMRKPDPSALVYLYRVLQNQMADGVTLKIVQEQMKREYGQTFVDLLRDLAAGNTPEIPEVPVEEIEGALVWLKDSHRFDAELANFTPGVYNDSASTLMGKTTVLATQVGPRRELSAYVHFPRGVLAPLIIMLPVTESRIPTEKLKKNAGPNFDVPVPREDYTRPPALQAQIELLKKHPLADYILYGHSDDPTTPYTIEFVELSDAMAFLHFRRRLFERGGFDLDALVYILMALEPALRRRKISVEALHAQLGREYHAQYVTWAASSIRNGIYYRRDGKEFDKGAVPAEPKEMKAVIPLLKEIGRFSNILGRITPAQLTGLKT